MVWLCEVSWGIVLYGNVRQGRVIMVAHNDSYVSKAKGLYTSYLL